MAKNNALPPASQPWVRELERRIKELENKSYRTDSKVNVMSSRVMAPKMDLDALSVTEIRVGGDEPQVFEHEVQNYSISGNTITASTPPAPTQRGFFMEWEVDVTASVDYIQASSSLDPEMYEDPEEPEGALAGEETTYFADASYMIEDVEESEGGGEDEMFNPVPPIVSFTLHNPAKTAFTFTVHAVRARFVIPGEGGLRITQGGEIFFEDGAGRDSIFREITDEQAQAIIETADNLAQAQQDLEDARTEAQQNFGILDDKLGQAFPGDNIFDVDLAIEQAKDLAEQQFDAAMTKANGKNAVSYTTFGNSTTPPGTAPTTAMGSGRHVHDMHRNRLTNGTIIGEWIWTGSAWTRLELSDAMLSSLDVGKLTAGTTDIETAVINQLWGQLGVFDKLDVRTDAYVSGINLKDGAVTARTLNVVPATGTGGMELLPPGLRIIPSDAEAGTAVSLRTDEENWISFAKAGKSTFSVNPDGHLTAQQVDANESLQYMGVELSTVLDQFSRGVISNAVDDNTLNITVGSNQARLVANTFRTPAENRMVRVSLAGKISTYGERFVRIYLRQSTGNNVKATNTSVKTWHVGSGWFHDFDFTLTQSVNLWGWPYDNTITLGVFLECVTTGETVELHRGNQSLIVEDVGPSVRTQVHTPWAPTTGGGGGGGNETEPGTRDYTYQRKSSWVRSFLGNNNHYNYGAGRAYQGLQPGTGNGNLKSMIGWPSLTSTLNGATIKSIKVKIKNDHTYANSGATAYIGLHGRTSAPATFALSVADVITASFTRSQTRTLTIPSQYHAGFKNGDYTGISLYTGTSSNSRYGYWDGTNAELIIEYEK